MAQGRTESCERSGCIVFAAIEAAIYASLNELAQWLEEGCDEKGGDDDCHTGCLMEEPAQELCWLLRASVQERGSLR